jgi:hypothetical protein
MKTPPSGGPACRRVQTLSSKSVPKHADSSRARSRLVNNEPCSFDRPVRAEASCRAHRTQRGEILSVVARTRDGQSECCGRTHSSPRSASARRASGPQVGRPHSRYHHKGAVTVVRGRATADLRSQPDRTREPPDDGSSVSHRRDHSHSLDAGAHGVMAGSGYGRNRSKWALREQHDTIAEPGRRRESDESEPCDQSPICDRLCRHALRKARRFYRAHGVAPSTDGLVSSISRCTASSAAGPAQVQRRDGMDTSLSLSPSFATI